MLTRCNTCRGTKKVTGLGGMVKECATCKGVGFVKIDEVLKVNTETQTQSFNDDFDAKKIDKRSKEYKALKAKAVDGSSLMQNC